MEATAGSQAHSSPLSAQFLPLPHSKQAYQWPVLQEHHLAVCSYWNQRSLSIAPVRVGRYCKCTLRHVRNTFNQRYAHTAGDNQLRVEPGVCWDVLANPGLLQNRSLETSLDGKFHQRLNIQRGQQCQQVVLQCFQLYSNVELGQGCLHTPFFQ